MIPGIFDINGNIQSNNSVIIQHLLDRTNYLPYNLNLTELGFEPIDDSKIREEHISELCVEHTDRKLEYIELYNSNYNIRIGNAFPCITYFNEPYSQIKTNLIHQLPISNIPNNNIRFYIPPKNLIDELASQLSGKTILKFAI